MKFKGLATIIMAGLLLVSIVGCSSAEVTSAPSASAVTVEESESSEIASSIVATSSTDISLLDTLDMFSNRYRSYFITNEW